ncbi:MAG: O-acetyl-ADP-ribose deacetylase [Deltaproteobacteria bacterium]|nr:O-acetyl-ADP-ribose deacetylase [Deltaproteobacteria bacterium]
MKIIVNGVTIECRRADITLEDTDAVVNAANSRLAGGGGVDGDIHRAGGPAIMEECRKIGSCPTGRAVITGGGRLKARYVIHAVGPVYRDGAHKEAELLAGAYLNSLKLADEKGLASIAFPSISTGAYGYPVAEASEVAVKTAVEFAKSAAKLRLIRFVLFSDSDLKTYERALKRAVAE